MSAPELVARLLLAPKGRTLEFYKEYLQAAVFLPSGVIVILFGLSRQFNTWFWGGLAVACAVLLVTRRRWLMLAALTLFLAVRFGIKLALTQRWETLVGTVVFGVLTWFLMRRVG
jgi:hypothetical protein